MMHKRTISVIGLGYVGLTTAAELSKKNHVIGFDIDSVRIQELKKGNDHNGEVSKDLLISENLVFTNNPDDLKEADFHIISVPTPLDKTKHPDLTLLMKASQLLGERIKRNDIVVYESTVYPGTTEEICIPILEEISGLKSGNDFFVGYSPERINPADKEHVFTNIIKVIAAPEKQALDIITAVYDSVITSGIYPVSSIRVAEACKLMENIQRDVNIALMNDLAMMMHMLDINVAEVINAMKTKWNYISFQPGLVGGHCIGNNSYYLMHKAESAGYHSEIISAARRTNEYMPQFIVDQLIKCFIELNILLKGSRIAVAGLTYKENCSDVRDTGVITIINMLKDYGANIFVFDTIANKEECENDYGIKIVSWDKLVDLDAMIIAVAHKIFLTTPPSEFSKTLKKDKGLIMDVKNILNPSDFVNSNIRLWRL